jgi:hypothetical protein
LARDLVVSFHEFLKKKADSLQDFFNLTFSAKLLKGCAPYGTLPLQAKGGITFVFPKIFKISYSLTDLPHTCSIFHHIKGPLFYRSSQ